jgi:nicotinamidase-related amidase
MSRYDYILIAGEAKSHCVLETEEDLLEEFSEAPGILRRLFILRDCTSSVTHPTIDFDAIAEKRFAEFAQHGINFIKTTDPMPFRSRGPASPRESAAA